MELSVQTSPFHFLRCIMQEVHFQEETADVIVPDREPDIAYIAGAFAEVILRGKDHREKSVTVAGGIKGSILYIPEQEQTPRCLELYLPFSVKFEDPALTEQSQTLCSMRVRSVDARMLNSRKAALRVSIGCELTAYEPALEELCQPVAEGTGLQTRYETFRLSLPLETGESSFLLQDRMDLNGKPPVAQVCKLQCQLLQGEKKLVANKAVFKGTLLCRLLYLTPENTLQSHQQTFPYSQYCELGQDYDEERLQLLPMVTGYDWQTEQNGEQDGLSFSVHILTQCVVWGERELRLLRDAYVTKGSFQPQWKTYGFSSCLDRPCSTQTVRRQLPDPVEEVLDTEVYWDYPSVRQLGERVKVSVPVTMAVLARTETGTLSQQKVQGEAVQELPLATDCICRSSIWPTGEEYTALLGGSAEVRCSVELCSVCRSEKDLTTICGGVLEPAGAGEHRSATIIVRTVPADTCLWDLAKACRTTEGEIMAANHLTSDCLTEDTLLLLPVF